MQARDMPQSDEAWGDQQKQRAALLLARHEGGRAVIIMMTRSSFENMGTVKASYFLFYFSEYPSLKMSRISLLGKSTHRFQAPELL